MSTSRKHHFLPKFYLKGFTNEIGQFNIYDCKNNKVKKKGKYFFPSSHFYEIDSNTIAGEDDQDDFIEKLYEKLDNITAKKLEQINRGSYKNRFNIDEMDMPYLNNFASHIFWRNPNNVSTLKNYIDKYSLSQLGLKIIDKDGNHDYTLSEKFKNEPQFHKAYKLYNAMIDSIRGFNCRTPYHIFERPDNLPSILSDTPLIFESTDNFKVYKDDYILPLSRNRIFVKRNLQNKFDHQLHFLIDLISVKQSVSNFAFTDYTYVEYLSELDLSYGKTLSELKLLLFEKLQ